MPQQSVPVTWKTLVEAKSAYLPDNIEVLLEVPEIAEISSRRSGGVSSSYPYSDALIGTSNILVQLLCISGPQSLREASLKPFWNSVEAGIAELETAGVTLQARSCALEILSLINIAESCGVSLAGDDIGSRATPLRLQTVDIMTTGLPLLSEKERYIAALELLVESVDGEESALVNQCEELLGSKINTSTQQQHAYGFDTLGFLKHLIAARVNHQDETVVLTALHSFIESFPYKLGASTLDWLILPYAVRAVFCQIGDEPVGVVGDALNAIVTTLVVA